MQQGAKQRGIIFNEEIKTLVAVIVFGSSFSQGQLALLLLEDFD